MNNILISQLNRKCFNCQSLYCRCNYNYYIYNNSTIQFYVNKTQILFRAKKNEDFFTIRIPPLEISFKTNDTTISELIERIETCIIFQ